MSLRKLRETQAEIDLQILNLLGKRFELSKLIAEQKVKDNVSIENLELEKQKLKNLVKSTNLNKAFIEKLWHEIFKESKKIQKELID